MPETAVFIKRRSLGSRRTRKNGQRRLTGESLADTIKLQRPAPGASVDVHGNQVALLARSRCYQSSPTMTCSTCHDEHAPEHAAASYSNQCLTCHEPDKC